MEQIKRYFKFIQNEVENHLAAEDFDQAKVFLPKIKSILKQCKDQEKMFEDEGISKEHISQFIEEIHNLLDCYKNEIKRAKGLSRSH